MIRRKAILSLLLLVPAPSIGAAFAMIIFPNTPLGQTIFALSKLWLLVLPLAWLKLVDRRPISLSPPRKGGFAMAAFSGCVISIIISTAYLTIGNSLIDRQFLTQKLIAIGLGSPAVYIGAAAYWILVNSVLEEYVWRWFCVSQCEQFMPPSFAVPCSAFFFTIHHVVAMQVYLGTTPLILCSLGVFIGGATWSMMYVRYRSIWPGYLSHAIADLCVFGIGASILFGAA